MKHTGRHAVKLAEGSTVTVEGLGIPFGGPWTGADGQGRDLYGEYFSAKTELCLDWFSERPLLYGHGLNEAPGLDVVGRVKSWEVRSDGVWVQAQLDESSAYFDALQELITKGKLFFSSGSVEHLFAASKDGEILRWPWIELSLTPTPANLFAKIDQPTAEKHWQAFGGAPAVKSLTDRLKALPSEPVPAGGRDGYGAPDGSYEALICKLNRAVNALLCPSYTYDDDLWCYVIATFQDYVTVCRYGNGVQYFQVEYTLGADGTITLGDSRQVELAYVPVEDLPSDEAPLAVMSAHTIRSARTLLERTRDLRERRAKEHRPLSQGHTDRVRQARAHVADLVAGYDELLAEPQPTPATEAEARAVVETQAAYARSIALACGLEVPQ